VKNKILNEETIKGSNIAILKRRNQSLILSIIKEQGPISRIAIAKKTGLTKSAISKVVEDLIEMGLVEEVGIDNTLVGRKPVTLKLTTDNYFVIGVGIRRTEVCTGIADLQGDIITRKKVSLGEKDNQKIILKKLIGLIYKVIEDSDIQRKKVIGIGIGSPGPLYAHSGIVLSPPNFPGWHNIPLKKLIEEEFKVPAFIDNDANTCALGEKWFGGGQGIDNFIYLLCDKGVGAGIVIGGEVYRGVDGIAGELGHISISLRGKRCECGNYGCLENFVSHSAIVSKARKLISSGRKTMISRMVRGKPENIKVETIIKAAQKKDELALEILEEVARYLSIGIINLVNLFNTKTIIIGGQLAQAGEILLEPIKKIVKKRAYPAVARNLKIITGHLGEKVYVVGAVALALSFIFKDLELIKKQKSHIVEV